MAIAPLLRVTLYGTARQKWDVLDGLQALGCIHLTDLGEGHRPEPGEPIDPAAREALRYLLACPVRRHPERDASRFDLARVRDETVKIATQERDLQDQRDQLHRTMKRLEPWGEFAFPRHGELASLRLWLYALPRHRAAEILKPVRTWMVVSRDHRFAYVVVVSEAAPAGIPFPPVEPGDHSLSELRDRIERIDAALDDLHWRRVTLTRWTNLLASALNEADDRMARSRAAALVHEEGGILAVSGWVPRDCLAEVRRFAEQQALGLTISEPSGDDTPPTLLQNPDYLAGGEDAVRLYTTPSYRAWDPSGVVFFSFALFFAMILSDAGYGLLLGATLLLFWRRLGRSRIGRRLRPLALALVAASVGYGVLVGSYFGTSPADDSTLGHLRLLDLGDRTAMMRLAIGIGIVHLTLAHVTAAWSSRRSYRAFAPIGWVGLLLGGFLIGLAVTGTIGDQFRLSGAILAGTGAASILLFSSRRPLTSGIAGIGGRLLDGLKALTGVSQAFGDVLSYLRLFALGLASAQLASTFNDLAAIAGCCVGVGTLLALLVLVVGHGLNLTLAVVGGVVHGLRLNCIEFFGWSLPEEGRPFHAFRKKAGS